MGEPDEFGRGSGVSPRCSSASLNDNFFDIGQFHQFAADRIKARPPKRSRFQSFDVNAVQSKNAIDDRYTGHNGHHPCGRRDYDDRLRMFYDIDLYDNLVRGPHPIYANSVSVSIARAFSGSQPSLGLAKLRSTSQVEAQGEHAAERRACRCDHDFEWVTPDVRAPLGLVVVGVLGTCGIPGMAK